MKQYMLFFNYPELGKWGVLAAIAAAKSLDAAKLLFEYDSSDCNSYVSEAITNIYIYGSAKDHHQAYVNVHNKLEKQ
jgi:anti-sigma regulatory factor (Ser/Thr protein kinase)